MRFEHLAINLCLFYPSIVILRKNGFSLEEEKVGGFMLALGVGIFLIAFTVFAGLPQGFAWYNEMLIVLKGGGPILLGFIGLISIFVGVADIRDRRDERREEEKMKHCNECVEKNEENK